VLDRGPLPRDAAHALGAPSEAAAAQVERGIPVAWRGLGGESAGPARPVDASIPRRVDPAEAAAELEARRVVQRRTLMLWALVLAVVLFVVAQFWAAGRAATSFDHGLLRYRDGQFAAARQVWSGLAAGGDAHAQFMLGYMSETGLGQSWSARAAASWYGLAAEQGHVEAQWRLGTLYDRGLGVPWSSADARRWWAFAAEGGHAEAAFALGRSLFTVPRTTADLQAARVAFDRALALGWHEAATYAAVLSVVSDATNVDAIP
jgi:TPR repeat protein